MVRDLLYAWRVLLRNPGFAATAILSMAGGIAACTAVFSLVYTLLLRPLAVPHADSILSIYSVSKTTGTFSAGTSLPNYRDLAARTDLFEGVAAYVRVPILVDSGDETERVAAEIATANYHTLLGLRPGLGRLLTDADDHPGAASVVVLSDSYWRRRFAASPGAIGQQLRVNGVGFEIVGVAPASFAGVLLDWYGAPDVWVPLSQIGMVSKHLAELRLETQRQHGWLQLTARLRDGVSVASATAALQTEAEQLSRTYPTSNAEVTFTALLASRARFWPGRRGAAIDFAGVLLSIVGALMLIAVLNVANLLLARLATRQREISIRLAIGADRTALARQLLIEALVISGLATLASVPLTILLTRLIVRINLPFVVSRTLDLSPDWRVFSAAAGLCVACGLLLGLAPAWRAWRADVRSGLTSVPSSARRTLLGAWDLRHALAATQIAICLTLTLGTGLLGKSLIRLTRADLGFQPDRVTLFEIETFIRGYSKEQNAAFNRDLLARVRRLPGVEAASLAFIALPSPMTVTKTITVPGAQSSQASSDSPESRTRGGFSTRFNVVSSGYFDTMRMRMLAGRAFDDRDTNAAMSSAAIVNETAARRLWPDPARAIGQRIRVKDQRNHETDREIVGVVRDAIYSDPDEAPRPYLFEPLDRAWDGAATLHVLGPREPAELIVQVKRELRLLDRALAISEVSTLQQHVATRIAAPSLAAGLSVAASAVGVALAILGLYAVLAYLVAQRRTELAIRMSIGAAPRQILQFVAGFGIKIALAGTVLGLAGSFFTMRLISTQLRGVDARDPLVYASGIALVLLATFAACLLPARRAARLEPWAILRR